MKKNQSILKQVIHGSEIQVQSFSASPLIEVIGCERVLIENHISIASYDTQQIYIRVKYGMILIQGDALKLAYMSKEKLVITGKLGSIHLLNSSSL